MFLFGDVTLNTAIVMGLLISITGSIYFSLNKLVISKVLDGNQFPLNLVFGHPSGYAQVASAPSV